MPTSEGMEPAAVIDGMPTPLLDYTVHIENDTEAVYNRLGEQMSTVKTAADISGTISFPSTQRAIVPDSVSPETHTVYLYAGLDNLERRMLLTGVYFTSNGMNRDVDFIAERVKKQ